MISGVVCFLRHHPRIVSHFPKRLTPRQQKELAKVQEKAEMGRQ